MVKLKKLRWWKAYPTTSLVSSRVSQGEQYPPCGRVLNAAWGGVYAVGSDFFLYPTVYTQPHTAFNPTQ